MDYGWFLEHRHLLREENYNNRSDVIIKAFKFWQKCWAEELNSRPLEEKATIRGRSIAAVWKQTDTYIQESVQNIYEPFSRARGFMVQKCSLFFDGLGPFG